MDFGRRPVRSPRLPPTGSEMLGRALSEIVHPCTPNPPPMHKMPILIAGTCDTLTLPLMASYADSWCAAFPDHPEDLEPAVAALRKWWDEIGRDPHDIEAGLGLEPTDLERSLNGDVPAYLEMSFTQFTLGFNGSGWDVFGRGRVVVVEGRG